MSHASGARGSWNTAYHGITTPKCCRLQGKHTSWHCKVERVYGVERIGNESVILPSDQKYKYNTCWLYGKNKKRSKCDAEWVVIVNKLTVLRDKATMGCTAKKNLLFQTLPYGVLVLWQLRLLLGLGSLFRPQINWLWQFTGQAKEQFCCTPIIIHYSISDSSTALRFA